ncbi:amino acid transporter [Solibacillus sp. MA9]|uniref:Amino acid transporter n=1 Tax=Solibacillus palustris TaxID=2908203 RepID=A0ABS9UHS1_9BACL|nr:amino acid transporter [Solibacillus sp. MA9]MCH7323909.1 amino acid transporter [Solibacillus sp. MA9]
MSEFHYWQQLSQPSRLAHSLENSENGKLKGYIKWVTIILGFTLAYFIVRDIWGMNTTELTYLLVNGDYDQYRFARLISLIGAILTGLLYFLFYYYFIPGILYAFTSNIPYHWIQKVQLYVIPIIIVEKLITVIIFAAVGFATPFTFFSVAPMVSYVYYQDYLLYFLNQITVASVVTVWIQYTFLAQWENRKKVLLIKLILLQVIIAAIVALISILPMATWIEGWLGK